MVEEGRGNLLMADVDALVNTVNTVGVMGKGIALQFKRAYPANFHAYRAACARGEVRVGEVWPFDTGIIGARRYILNFPTKRHWRTPSRLEDIAAGLDSLVDVVTKYGITSVAIPALGCGNGGLNWADVRPLIERACERMAGVRSVIFAPEGAPAPATMPNATPRPPLSPALATLLVAIARYLQRARLQEVREGVSELEIQKLAYFLQVLGAPLRLSFSRGTYGPYAIGLSHILDRFEGHYLTGIGDRSTPVTRFAPVNLTPDSLQAADEVLDARDDELRRLEALLDLVDGFETPYGLELLATVHYASVQEPTTYEGHELTARVGRWSLRKARMFTDRHVQLAAQRLSQRQIVPV